MAKIERFEQIEAWQTARELTKQIYRLSNTGEFARAQTYVAQDVGYLDQLQSAQLMALAEKYSRQISNFMWYLQQDLNSRAPTSFREPVELYEPSEPYQP